MATVEIYEQLTTYLIKTDSMGGTRFEEAKIAKKIQTLTDDIAYAEVHSSDDEIRLEGYYHVYVSLSVQLSLAKRQLLLRKVIDLLRKDGLIEHPLDEQVKGLQ